MSVFDTFFKEVIYAAQLPLRLQDSAGVFARALSSINFLLSGSGSDCEEFGHCVVTASTVLNVGEREIEGQSNFSALKLSPS